MNTTIRQLAMQYFNELDTYNKSELSHKYYKETISYNFTSLTNEKIENIFYQEVIVKWANESEDRENYYCLAPVFVKQAYLKEHTKELPKIDTNIIKENTDEILSKMKAEYPIFELGEDIYTVQGKPQSVLNTIDVEEYKETLALEEYYLIPKELIHSLQGDLGSLASYMPQHFDELALIAHKLGDYQIVSQPKAIEDNAWDEVRRGYKKLTHRSILSNGEHDLLDYLEQHYSLIKK